MGSCVFSQDLPSGLVCDMAGGGKAVQGLVAGAFWPVLFSKLALDHAGSCARASSVSLHAFMGSLEKQSACIHLHDSSFPCWLDCSFP